MQHTLSDIRFPQGDIMQRTLLSATTSDAIVQFEEQQVADFPVVSGLRFIDMHGDGQDEVRDVVSPGLRWTARWIPTLTRIQSKGIAA
jgi:hypothetical protein